MTYTLVYDTATPLAESLLTDAAAVLVDEHTNLSTAPATITVLIAGIVLRTWHVNEN